MVRRLGIPSVGLMLAALFAVAALLVWRDANHSGPQLPAEQLPQTPAQETAWPADTLVLDMSQAREVVAPFKFGEAADAADGTALVLPKGAGSKDRAGRAVFAVQPPESGAWLAWARVKWDDECSNSVELGCDAQPPCIAGNDRLFGRWHWVRAGRHVLTRGAHTVTLLEREDGVAIQQLVFTRDASFEPSGIAGAAQAGIHEPREFRDDFGRSPGHGLGSWAPATGSWELTFSFDPNRIPNQYSLTGRATDRPAFVWLKEAPWKGCRVGFSFFPAKDGWYGMAQRPLDDSQPPLLAGFELAGTRARLLIEGPGLREQKDLGAALRMNQWHRAEIERSQDILRVWLDGERLFERTGLERRTIGVGLFAASGEACFDDVAVLEARRPAEGSVASGGRLTGPDAFRLGLWHFTRASEPDPSDYLDFTPAEYRVMDASADADKLRREAKTVAVIAHAADEGFWVRRSGSWGIRSGVLVGQGPDATLSLSQEVVGEFQLEMEMRLVGAQSLTEVTLYGQDQEAVRVCAGPLALPFPIPPPVSSGRSVPPGDEGEQRQVPSAGSKGIPFAALALPVPADGQWHRFGVRATEGKLSAWCGDDAPREAPLKRGLGGRIALGVVNGRAEFDDVKITVNRRCAGGGFYAFDGPETDWWREGGAWMDHNGIACILASHWISLIAPQGQGLLWHKRTFGPDLMLALDVLENGEWFGWNAPVDHVHHPYDHIQLVLATEDRARSYRLEVNAENRSATVLYRDGKVVARVPQDGSFPIQYYGGHAPYSPRRSRLALAKTGNALLATVNGRKVLSYRDPEPLEVRHAAFGGHHTRANFSCVEIRTLTTPIEH